MFTLRASNSAGSALSFGAVLTVTTSPVAPTIVQPPTSTTVNAGDSAAFYVEANGTAPLSYQWRRDGSPIVGATGALYVLYAVAQSDDGAQFSVVVSNSAGTVTSPVAQLTVAPIASAPTITVQPQSVTAEFRATVVLQVSATGTGPFAYQWLRNGASIADANNASYTIASFGPGDNGARFSMVVSNSSGIAVSASAITTVSGVTVTTVSDVADGDASGYGEGFYYLGSLTADASGNLRARSRFPAAWQSAPVRRALPAPRPIPRTTLPSSEPTSSLPP